jgi:hypothetical protein
MAAGVLPLPGDSGFHITSIRKFDRVAEEVHEHLAEAEAIVAVNLSISPMTAVMASVFWSLLTPRTYEQLVKQEQMSIEEMVSHLSRLFFKGLAAETSQERNAE